MKELFKPMRKMLRVFRIQLALLLSLLVFFGMYLLSYHDSVRKMKANEIARVQEIMQHEAKSLGEAFLVQYSLMPTLQSSNSIKNLVQTQRLETSRFGDIIKVQKLLEELPGSDLLELHLLVDNENGLLISVDKTLHNFRFSYEKGVYSYDMLTYDDFLALVRTRGKSGLSAEAFTKAMNFVTYDYRGNELLRKEKLLYIYKLPLSGVTDMYALIGIDVDVMREAFSQNNLANDEFFIYNTHELIYQSGTAYTCDPTQQITYVREKGITLLSVHIPNTKLYCVMALEDDEVLQEIERLTQMSYIVTACFIIDCIILLSVILFSLIRPAYLLAEKTGFSAQLNSNNLFEHISKRIDDIRLDNQQMVTTISRWEPFLHTHLIEHLLRGMPLTEVENELLSRVIDKEQGWHVALVGRLQAGGEIPSLVIMSIMAESLICPLEDTRVAVITGGKTGTEFAQDCQKLLDALNMAENSPAYAVGYCPQVVEPILLCQAFARADRALSKALWWENSAVIAYKEDASSVGYVVPYETLEQLQQQVLAGNIAAVEQLLEAQFIRAENTVSNDEMHHRLMYHELEGVLMRISRQMSAQPALDGLREAEKQRNFRTRMQILKKAFLYAAEIRACTISSSQQDVASRLKGFIQHNYADMDMSLTRAAQEFGICEQNFSKLFKDETGTNFSVYLENVRIAAAEDLLRKGMSVGETAEKCGYASVNTFGKAFKRRCGVSPTDWLRAQREKSKNVHVC